MGAKRKQPSNRQEMGMGREEFVAMLKRGAEATRAWCFNEGLTPHPLLLEAFAYVMAAVGGDTALAGGGGSPSLRRSLGKMDALLGKLPEEERAELETACEQVRQFIASFPNAKAFGEAIGYRQ